MKKNLITTTVVLIIVTIVSITILLFLNKSGKIVMVTEAGFAPYEFYDGGEIVGVDIEIAKAIADELGKELVIINTEFEKVLNMVKSGKADFAAAGLSITEERLAEVDFSIEYAVSKQVVIVRKDSGIRTFAELDGKKVSVQLGTVADMVLTEENPEVRLVRRKRFSLAVKDVVMGTSMAVVMDSLAAEDAVRMYPELTILKKELFEDTYGIAVKKGNDKLLKTINEVLQRLIDEGKIDEYTIYYVER